MPFTRGDVYFLVQRAHEGASLSRNTQDRIVDFVVGENLTGFALGASLALPCTASSLTRRVPLQVERTPDASTLQHWCCPGAAVRTVHLVRLPIDGQRARLTRLTDERRCAGSQSLEALRTQQLVDLPAAATFVTKNAGVNGGNLLGADAFFEDGVDFCP